MQAVCDILEQLVDEKVIAQYAIGGATAAGFHGEPIATRDIDVFVFISPPLGSLLISLESLFSRLRELGFSDFEEEGLLVHGFPVQFISARDGLETDALENGMMATWNNHRMRIISPEYLAAMALDTARPKDRARIIHLLSIDTFDHAEFNRIITTHGLVQRWMEWRQALGLNHTPDH